MDKFFSQLALDAALDQLLLYVAPEELGDAFRLLGCIAIMGVQLFLIRGWVLSWAGLESEAYQPADIEPVV